MTDNPNSILLKNAGKTVDCRRCGVRCKVAETANPRARPVRHADKAGFCAECVVTRFLQIEINAEAILPPGVRIGEALLAPHVQESFARLFRTGAADLQNHQIDWRKVVGNWNLPLSKGRQ